MTPEAIEESINISDCYTFSEYLREVKRHIDQTLSDSQVKDVRESYMADYSVHETITQLGLI